MKTYWHSTQVRAHRRIRRTTFYSYCLVCSWMGRDRTSNSTAMSDGWHHEHLANDKAAS